MYIRKTCSIIALVALLSITMLSLDASGKTTYNSVEVLSFDYEMEPLLGASQGDSVSIEIDSDMPVDIYVISFSDWLADNYDGALWYGSYQDYASFWVDIPDDQDYYLVFENYNYVAAWVDYYYEVDDVEDIEAMASLTCLICGVSGLILFIITGIIIVVVIVSLSKKKKKRGYKKEIEDLEKKISEMKKLGIDTKKERELLEKYKSK